jgi:hypothetical protein
MPSLEMIANPSMRGRLLLMDYSPETPDEPDNDRSGQSMRPT